MAVERETKLSKPIDKASERGVSEIPGRNANEHMGSLVTHENLKAELLELG